ncbi:redoxin family protein [Erwinia sp. J316]|uniref:Redoxin family protein n=1 Tax=Erwinia sorbitola TaxID=2681984 RepID=A0A6I6EZW6_9GAMM|nr:redoxin family protein [Erwinia sorbitola]QGU89743.1 redoxin family protein [Erwinia sorbitola]
MNQFKKVSNYLLLPLLVMILFIRLIDGIRAPNLPDDIAVQILHTIDGKNLTLAELSEKTPLLVWFWDRWCGTCHDTIPLLMKLNDKHTNVLTIANRSGNDINIVRFLNGHHLTLPVVNDNHGELAARWQITTTPTLLIVAKGEVVGTTSGWTSAPGIGLRLWWVRKWHY